MNHYISVWIHIFFAVPYFVVLVSPVQLTEDKLKHRWQVHRTKYERKAKEYLERIRDPNGFYVEDDTSEVSIAQYPVCFGGLRLGKIASE